MAGVGGGEGGVLVERGHGQSQKATKGLGASGTSAEAEPSYPLEFWSAARAAFQSRRAFDAAAMNTSFLRW